MVIRSYLVGNDFVRAATLQKCEVKLFSVFLCQFESCREIWREILHVLRFPSLGVRIGKFHRLSSGVEK